MFDILDNISTKVDQTAASYDFSQMHKQDLANAFGVSVGLIYKWVKMGCPQNIDGKTHNLAECISWAIARKVKNKLPDEPEESSRWLTEFRKEKALHAKLERQKAEGRLFNREDIVKKWCSMVSLFTAGLELFADRLPPLLEGRDQLAMREIIDSEVGYLREAFAREGEYTPSCKELPVTKKSAPQKKTSKRK